MEETPDNLTNESPSSALSNLARVEAALFLLREPAPSRRLATLAGLEEGVRLRDLVNQLNVRYQREGSAFCVVEVAGGWQLRTLPQYAPWLFRLQEIPVEIHLTNAAMETLAIVAYQQPVARVRIEGVRGVRCGEILRQLLDQDLIKIVGHAEELGRPFLYGTTKRFLQVFGLMRLEDLNGLHSGLARPSGQENTNNSSGSGVLSNSDVSSESEETSDAE